VKQVPLDQVRGCLPPETPTVTPARRASVIASRAAAVRRRFHF
jgi:hypothetical protein